MADNTVNIFCGRCNEATPHAITVDNNGEFLATCQAKDCPGFQKFPADADLVKAIEAHNDVNTPSVLVNPETGLVEPTGAQQEAIVAAIKAHG